MIIRSPLLIYCPSIFTVFLFMLSIYSFVSGYLRLRHGKIIFAPNEFIVYMLIRLFKGGGEAEQRRSKLMSPQMHAYNRMIGISFLIASVFLLLEAIRRIMH